MAAFPYLLAVRAATCALCVGAVAPLAEAQGHRVPFASSGNAIELALAGPEGAPLDGATIAVVSVPSWVQFADEAAAAEGPAAVARLSFDVSHSAPVGEAAEVTFEVWSGGAVVATHRVRLVVSAPTVLKLDVPYPNPTRGAVVVPFEVPAEGRVRLAVLDVLGREVAVLVDAVRSAGAHDVRIGPGTLAAGAYVVRLVVGDEVRVGHLTVAR